MLTLIRGLPGSGKSTLAGIMIDAWGGKIVHYEADHYFKRTGEYLVDPSALPQSHNWCQALTLTALTAGQEVIVSNTFVTIKEMEPYIQMTRDLNIVLNVIECKGNFGSVHNIPKSTLDKMRAKWQDYKPN
jgi:predicted kinase